MPYKLITAASNEPVAIGEAKTQTRLAHCADDKFLGALITAARKKVEEQSSRQLVTATWELQLDRFPCEDGGIIYLEKPPIQSVSSIKYIDPDGDEQTLDASAYQVDAVSEPGRVKPAYGQSWPSIRCEMNAVKVRFVAGYGAPSAVSGLAKQAILMLVAHYSENREATLVGTSINEVPLGFNDLLSLLKWGL
jgi:uncharacterized phiE125 gp8 family phage protein